MNWKVAGIILSVSLNCVFDCKVIFRYFDILNIFHITVSLQISGFTVLIISVLLLKDGINHQEAKWEVSGKNLNRGIIGDHGSLGDIY